MEFRYTLTESEYLRACSIKVAPLQADRPWLAKNGYALLMLLFLWFAVVCGILLADSDFSTITASGKLNRIPIALAESVTPTFIIACLYFLTLRVVHPFLSSVRAVRLRHFHSDPSCRRETSVSISAEAVRFQCSPICFSQYGWDSYERWIEENDILLFITRSRSIQILSLAGLTGPAREELRLILNTALPLKK
jgi:hypothetical protein